MSHGLEIIYGEEPDTRSPRRFWVPALLGAVVVAMLILGALESPIPTPPELTAPPPLAIATMPDLDGISFIAAGNRLSEAGLDRSLLFSARWIANPDAAAGIVTGQSPPPGSDVFHEEEIKVVMSSGGPTISWADVPEAMQELIDGVLIVRGEPVLVVETPAGPAYKTDWILFGGCRAVDLTRDTFYDQTYSETCPTAPNTTIGGWLGDGAMYAVEGLPAQEYLDVASAISIGPNQPLGRQLWSSSPDRRAPMVEVDGRTIRVTGGHLSFVLKIPTEAKLTPNEVAELIKPIDIRGDLVVTLSPPLAFYDKPGLAGNGTSGGQAARRHRHVPGEPFSASSVVSVVSRPGDLEVIVAEQFSSQVAVLAVPSTAWARGSTNEWQFAFPTGWIEPARNSRPDQLAGFALSTADQFLPVEMCGRYPVGALRAIDADDAWVSVSPTSERDAPQWPTYFSPRDLKRPASRPACLEGVEATVYVDTRTLNGRSFSIVVAFGSDVSNVTRDQAVAILASYEPVPSYGNDETG